MLGHKIVIELQQGAKSPVLISGSELSTNFGSYSRSVIPPRGCRVQSMTGARKEPVDSLEACIAPALGSGNATLIDERARRELLLREPMTLSGGTD
jgi:hypothetical protein